MFIKIDQHEEMNTNLKNIALSGNISKLWWREERNLLKNKRREEEEKRGNNTQTEKMQHVIFSNAAGAIW